MNLTTKELKKLEKEIDTRREDLIKIAEPLLYEVLRQREKIEDLEEQIRFNLERYDRGRE